LLNYHYSKNIFISSLQINPSKNTEFVNFLIIDKLLGLDLKSKDEENSLNKVFLEKFYRELIDYEEFLTILKNNNSIKKKISNLSSNDQNEILFTYVNNFQVIKEENNIIVNLTWDKENEIIPILHDTISLAKKKLELSIYKDYEELLSVAKNLSKNNLEVTNDILKDENFYLQELNSFKNQTDDIPDPLLDYINIYLSYFFQTEFAVKKK
tara:strand:- start:371 stop:1003 length:633 start_codon:yes stop_codon:yes gene_type:complete